MCKDSIQEATDNLTDESLCAKACKGSRDAEEILVTRYTRLVRQLARPYFLAGGDSDDLIQEGMIGLIVAVREYDADKAATFRTYAEVCIRNRLYSALRSATRGKHSPLNQSIPLDFPFFDSRSITYGASSLAQPDPEDLVIGQEGARDMLQLVCRKLSDFETKILRLYLDGMTTREIANAVQKSPKSVDNAVQRIRRKVAQHIDSGDISTQR